MATRTGNKYARDAMWLVSCKTIYFIEQIRNLTPYSPRYWCSSAPSEWRGCFLANSLGLAAALSLYWLKFPSVNKPSTAWLKLLQQARIYRYSARVSLWFSSPSPSSASQIHRSRYYIPDTTSLLRLLYMFDFRHSSSHIRLPVSWNACHSSTVISHIIPAFHLRPCRIATMYLFKKNWSEWSMFWGSEDLPAHSKQSHENPGNTLLRDRVVT